METSPIKILAIDNNQDNLIILRAVISDAFPRGHVLTSHTGRMGIEIARSEEPDLILLDTELSEIDGFEVCRRLKSEPVLREIPVAFITDVKGDRKNRITALECGAEAFISKPIDVVELKAQIRAMYKMRLSILENRYENERLTRLVNEKTSELKKSYLKTLNLQEKLKIENEARRESEQRYRSVFDCAALGICNISLDDKYLHVNDAFCRIVGYEEKELTEMSYKDITYEDDLEKCAALTELLINGNIEGISTEKRYVRKDGKLVTVLITVKLIKDLENRPLYTVTTIQDLSDRIESDNKLLYLGYHDQLTGCYNRRYFEEELRRIDVKSNFPISLGMGDLNGLKLINDSLGYDAGDYFLKRTAEIIRNECRDDDIVCRVGGDEFVIIFPRTDAEQAAEIISRIKETASKEKVSNLELSISFGHDSKKSEDQNVLDILGNAENDMYRHKIYERSSMKSKAIDIIMNTLFEKSKRESFHSQRVSKLASSIAAKMCFEEDGINRIRIAGLVHDIGKIGVDEKTLNKSGALSEEEWEKMKKHPEIGWRILRGAEEFSQLSEFILAHHERWDGQGYPNMLKGEEIPIEARVIAVADSYDAMTSQRTYRSGLSHEVAVEELMKCAGTQFDPEVVDVLVHQVWKVAETI